MKGIDGKFWVFFLMISSLSFFGCDEEALDREGRAGIRPLTQEEVFLVESSNKFAFDLLNQPQQNSTENISFSPVSAGAALGIVGNMLTDERFKSFQSEVGLPDLSQVKINKAFYELSTMAPRLDPSVEMKFTNSVWTNYRISNVNDVYSRLLAYYNADVLESFSDKPFDEKFITKWIQTNTNFKYNTIENFQPSSAFQVINLGLFDGAYFNQKAAKRISIDFNLGEGEVLKTDMNLFSDVEVSLFENSDGLFSFSIPLGNGEYKLDIISGALENKTVSLSDIGTGNEKTINHLIIPDILSSSEFAFDRSFSQFKIDDFVSKGLTQYFPDDHYNLSGRYLNKTLISIKGKKAGNLIEFKDLAQPKTSSILTLDRPFYFFISEESSQLILFAGRYNFPTN